jgi:AraC-like DNA-binding protein
VPYVTHKPAAPLSSFVDYLWWLSDKPAHARERIVPTGTQELVINLHENAFDIRGAGDEAHARQLSGAMVSGAYGRYFVIDTRAHASILGAHFLPGAAWPVLGIPPGELAGTHAELELLWGATARELRDQLGAAESLSQRFRILETALLTRLARPVRQHPGVRIAVQRLMGQSGGVGEVAAELGLSRRRLIQLFTAEVGMTPKVFGRVQRFQRAFSGAQGSTPHWSELALRAGYCDQSHLIRDFVELSGLPPTVLLANVGPQLKKHHVSDGGG